jgi:hypothetical protein
MNAPTMPTSTLHAIQERTEPEDLIAPPGGNDDSVISFLTLKSQDPDDDEDNVNGQSVHRGEETFDLDNVDSDSTDGEEMEDDNNALPSTPQRPPKPSSVQRKTKKNQLDSTDPATCGKSCTVFVC